MTCQCQSYRNGDLCESKLTPAFHIVRTLSFVVFMCTSLTNCDVAVDVDECASGPCQNGGVCTDDVNRYDCACAVGYTGAMCEGELNSFLDNNFRCMIIIALYANR